MVRIFSLPPCTLLIQDNVDSFTKSKDAADRIIYYIRLSTEQPRGNWPSFLIIVRAVWQAVKSLFGCSAWQRAIREVEEQIYPSWKNEAGRVDRDKLRIAAQGLLDRWVQDNVSEKEYMYDHLKFREGNQNLTKIDFEEGIDLFNGFADDLNESKDPADAIEHCVGRYTQKWPDDELKCMILAVKEIWNAVKWFFGYSSWQLAIHAIENHVYRDWSRELGGVDRAMLHDVADKFLRRLIQQSQILSDEELQTKIQRKYQEYEFPTSGMMPMQMEELLKTPQKKKSAPWNKDDAFEKLLNKFSSPLRKTTK